MLMLTAFASIALTSKPIDRLAAYDVVWTTPSVDSAGSMPIGNGEVVLNVWVEDKTGDLLFLIARTDALSEISRFLKLGRIRVHLDPSPFKGASDFKQRLNLHRGQIEVSGGSAKLTLLVDSDSHTILIKGSSAQPVRVKATVECWRNEPRELPKEEDLSAWTVHDSPFKKVESADVFLKENEPAVTWYHRNETTIVPQVLANQSLTGQKGAFDPILHRTFGGTMTARGFAQEGDRGLVSEPVKEFSLQIATHSAQTDTLQEWRAGLKKSVPVDFAKAQTRTTRWWAGFWDRSWIFVEGDHAGSAVPKNDFPLRKGFDSNNQNRFEGEIGLWEVLAEPVAPPETGLAVAASPYKKELERPANPDFKDGFTLNAWIKPTVNQPGRIFDKMTGGGDDGFIIDTHPGDALRMIVGSMTLSAPHCLKMGSWQMATATYNAKSGEAALYLDGKRVAHKPAQDGSAVTRGYLLQRYVQACQGRGAFPIKFNGGYYTVEPTPMGRNFDPDWRAWGDCHWFQNVRHMYHPMTASGDFEMMEPFFRLYEAVRPLAESRTRLYHNAEGAYFPETMSVFGTYSGGDYGWDRTGREPKDVGCPYWQYAWNQGPELVALMLDRWDYTRDESFLKSRVLPMAESVLRYFDTRFKKDAAGKIVLDPTQAVETLWSGVMNDMPATAGLIAVNDRLCALPSSALTPSQKTFFAKMKRACPDLPMEMKDGRRQLAPAQKYDPGRSNCENPELYGVWPFRVVSVAHHQFLEEAKRAYAHRQNRLDVGWGYDGNAAALLGMADEAARILQVKCANSHPAYRWPATWGPNFDWLPDQNHGGNLLETADLMLLQGDSLEEGGAIRLLPAWPKAWNVSFKLHAPGNTVVECEAKNGKILRLSVTPESRRKDIVLPKGWAM